VVVAVKPDYWVRTAFVSRTQGCPNHLVMNRSVTSTSCVIEHASGLGSIRSGIGAVGVEVYQLAVVALGSCNRGRAGQMAYDDTRHPL
jgi:hypothetical protein